MNSTIIAPPIKTGERERKTQTSKSYLADALSSKLKQLVYTDDGRQVTAGQLMAERLVNIAISAEANSDAISAQKLIYERIMGKAAVMKEEDTRQMPKVVFSLTEEGLDKVNKSAEEVIKTAEIEDDGSGLVIIETEGKTFVG